MDFKGVKKQTYSRRIMNYKFKDVENVDDLTAKTYTFLKKPTVVKGSGKLNRGDVVLKGLNDKVYGFTLEKFLKTYNLGNAVNKPVKRRGFKLSRKNMNKLKLKGKSIKIKASWGEEQEVNVDDYIVFENDGKGYYKISASTFKKNYK